MDTQRFILLLDVYEKGQATAAEEAELMRLFADPANEGDIEELLSSSLAATPPASDTDPARWEPVIRRILGKEDTDANPPTPLRSIRMARFGWAAAAMVLILAGVYLLRSRRTDPSSATNTVFGSDVRPGHSGATLHLSDGRTVNLDSAGNGTVAIQGKVAAVKSNGELKYVGHSTQTLYNTVSTAAGQRWQLTLPDGTRAWLDAASSIRYPLAFTGDERKVEISGEVYFEVARDAKKPFYAAVGGTDIRVLGTSFNINAYPGEERIRATLIEGSIKVGNALLRPGEQASWLRGGEVDVRTDPDIEKTIAWKNGLFLFSKDDLASIMRQLSRWYKIEVQYEGDLAKKHFSGIISRDNNLSQILSMLESTGQVKFRIEGTKVTVMP